MLTAKLCIYLFFSFSSFKTWAQHKCDSNRILLQMLRCWHTNRKVSNRSSFCCYYFSNGKRWISCCYTKLMPNIEYSMLFTCIWMEAHQPWIQCCRDTKFCAHVYWIFIRFSERKKSDNSIQKTSIDIFIMRIKSTSTIPNYGVRRKDVAIQPMQHIIIIHKINHLIFFRPVPW